MGGLPFGHYCTIDNKYFFSCRQAKYFLQLQLGIANNILCCGVGGVVFYDQREKGGIDKYSVLFFIYELLFSKRVFSFYGAKTNGTLGEIRKANYLIKTGVVAIHKLVS
jgi:hypothetical protein